MTDFEISFEAEKDIRAIIDYTVDSFGADKAQIYASKLELCARSLAKRTGHFKDLNVGKYSVRYKHCEHHYVFGVDIENRPFQIIAVFHERMDLLVRLSNRLNA